LLVRKVSTLFDFPPFPPFFSHVSSLFYCPPAPSHSLSSNYAKSSSSCHSAFSLIPSFPSFFFRCIPHSFLTVTFKNTLSSSSMVQICITLGHWLISWNVFVPTCIFLRRKMVSFHPPWFFCDPSPIKAPFSFAFPLIEAVVPSDRCSDEELLLTRFCRRFTEKFLNCCLFLLFCVLWPPFRFPPVSVVLFAEVLLSGLQRYFILKATLRPVLAPTPHRPVQHPLICFPWCESSDPLSFYLTTGLLCSFFFLSGQEHNVRLLTGHSTISDSSHIPQFFSL